jgi:CBS-domain-containing membrane protein
MSQSSQSAAPTHTVSEVMTRDVVTLSPDDSWLCAVRFIVDHRVHALPVVDGDRRVVGMVAESDLMPKEERLDAKHSTLLPPLQLPRDRRRAHALTVREVMSSRPVTITPDTPLGEAGRVMHRKHVGRLPVVDDDGRLIGIVTRSDLLATFLRDDAQVRADVRRALEELGPEVVSAVDVSVTDCAVTLRGELPLASQAMDVAAAIEQVPGVVGVDNRLQGRVDDVHVPTVG